jgi:MFS family permease
LLSLFNMLGRFFWSSISDYTGRKNVYYIYLLLGPLLYFLFPTAGRMGSTPFFVGLCVLILTMYGGGFAAIPAYLSDLFGTLEVGAIHGRLITSWSVAGVLGPLLVNRIRDYQIAHGAVGVERYAPTMYLMCGLLLVAALCNYFIKPVDSKYHVKDVPYSPTSDPQLQEES